MPSPEFTPGRALLALGLLLIPAAAGLRAATADDYPPHPDSVVQAGVPKGDMLRLTLDGSRVFPGTSREVLIYVDRKSVV